MLFGRGGVGVVGAWALTTWVVLGRSTVCGVGAGTHAACRVHLCHGYSLGAIPFVAGVVSLYCAGDGTMVGVVIGGRVCGVVAVWLIGIKVGERRDRVRIVYAGGKVWGGVVVGGGDAGEGAI